VWRLSALLLTAAVAVAIHTVMLEDDERAIGFLFCAEVRIGVWFIAVPLLQLIEIVEILSPVVESHANRLADMVIHEVFRIAHNCAACIDRHASGKEELNEPYTRQLSTIRVEVSRVGRGRPEWRWLRPILTPRQFVPNRKAAKRISAM
jgi:hypothetical protein